MRARGLATLHVALLQRQLPLQPIQLGLVEMFVILVHHGERLGQQGQAFFGLPSFLVSLGQQRKNPGLKRLCSHGPQGSLPLAHLPYAFFSFPLLSQCPASRYGSTRRNLRKPLLGREGHGGLGPRLSRLPLPAELVKPGNIDKSPG